MNPPVELAASLGIAPGDENWTGFHEGDGFSGYVLHVNDNGNATLYDGLT